MAGGTDTTKDIERQIRALQAQAAKESRGGASDTSADGRVEMIRALVIGALLTVALYFVPYAGVVTYPLRLLGTFIHEGSHALMAILTGGSVGYIKIFPDGSGVTGTFGGWNLLITSAGYLGATAFGAGVIALVRRGVRGRWLLFGVGAIIALLTLGFIRPWSNLFGFGWGVALAAGLFVAGWRMPERWASWSAAFVGMQCILNALFDLRTLFTLSTMPGAPPNDAAILFRYTLIPPIVWASLWIATAAALLWFTLRPAAWRTK